MQIPGENIEKFLIEILNEFFDHKTVMKFTKKSLMLDPAKTKDPSKLSARKNEHTGTVIKISEQIDLIITLAENKLSLEKFLELLHRIGQYSISTGEFTTAVYIYEKILSKSKGKKGLDLFTANSYRSLAEVFSRQAVWEISFAYINRAKEIYSKHNNKEGYADCENLIGTIYGDLGNLAEAQIHFEKAYSLVVRNRSDKHLTSKIKMNLGIINNIRGNINKALDFYRNALVDFESMKDYKRIAEIRHNLGMLYCKQQKYKLAHSEFDKSIKLSEKSGDMQTLGFSYLGKANAYAVQKEYFLGEDFAEKALEVCQELKDMLSIADTYKIKGVIQRELKNFEVSEHYLTTSLRLNKELKNQLNKAETEKEIGILYMETGKKTESKNYLRRSIRYYTRIGDIEEAAGIKNLIDSL